MTISAPRRNHAAWAGPLLALLGLVTYFAVAVKIPDLRDSAAANLLIVGAGVGLAAWGVLRRRNWKSWLGLGSAALFAALLVAYVFGLSNQLPSSDTAPALGAEAPELRLPDQSGRVVELAALSDRRVVVVFYRGFW
jgi:peptidoglycan/LPS O-acetylase OafA/YrhL